MKRLTISDEAPYGLPISPSDIAYQPLAESQSPPYGNAEGASLYRRQVFRRPAGKQ
jgi:hypothetical protein